MGVYIKGMEMPQNCICCDLSHEDGWCPAKQTFTDRYTYETCPLVPVPPHGRLIDTSEKIRVQIYDDMTEDFHMVEMTINDLLNQGWVEAVAPTIIPAEEV